MSRTPQQIADELNSLHAKAVNIVEGTIAAAAFPGGSISFTYRNPVDGQTYTATGTAWNVCSPSRVSALKLPDGSWIVIGAHESETVREVVHVDRRARAQPQTGGKIQVLFSTIEGAERVFWVGGDRVAAKRIYAVPKDLFVASAQISNAGGNKFLAGISLSSVGNSFLPFSAITISAIQRWDVAIHSLNTIFSLAPAYRGHGFWTQEVGGSADLGLSPVTIPLTSLSQYLGTSREIPGGQTIWVPAERLALGIATNALTPTVDKERYFYQKTQHSGGGNTYLESEFNAIFKTFSLILLGQNAASALYYHSDSHYHEHIYLGYIYGQEKPDNVREYIGLKIDELRLIANGQDIALGGDVSFRFDSGLVPIPDIDGSLIFEWLYPDRVANLIGETLYVVNLGTPNSSLSGARINSFLEIPESAWNPTQSKNLTIDIYDLGPNTTKRSVTARVQAIKQNAQIHSLSYHP